MSIHLIPPASTGEICGELIYHEEVMRVLDAELYLTRVSFHPYPLPNRTGLLTDLD